MDKEPASLPISPVIRKHLTVKGYTLFEITEDKANFAKAKQYIFDRLARGEFIPRIDRIFPFADIVDAHRYMESNAQVGKIVVTF